MISAIGPTGSRAMIDLFRANGAKAAAPATPAAAEEAAQATTPAALLAAQGAPIDGDKVAAIRAALAAGTYRIDAHAIAERMIALDLPSLQ